MCSRNFYIRYGKKIMSFNGGILLVYVSSSDFEKIKKLKELQKNTRLRIKIIELSEKDYKKWLKDFRSVKRK